MKRLVLFLISLMLLCTMCACGSDESENSSENGTLDAEKGNAVTLDLAAEADAIIQKYALSGGNRYSSGSDAAGEYLDEDLIRSYYGDAAEMPNFDDVEEYVVYIDESKPIKPCEFGIFKMKDGADTEEFMLFLKARIDLKLETAKAYPTMDTEPLKTAVFTDKCGYIWYCVVKDGNDDINKTLEGKF